MPDLFSLACQHGMHGRKAKTIQTGRLNSKLTKLFALAWFRKSGHISSNDNDLIQPVVDMADTEGMRVRGRKGRNLYPATPTQVILPLPIMSDGL